MTDNQRDLFMYLWSRRRAPGRTRIALRGAAIGALGGVVFALVMADGSTLPGVHAYDIAGQIRSTLTLYALSVPAFAALGWARAHQVWRAQERMYQAFLKAGARVPDRKPVLKMSERGPMLAVAIVVAIVAGFIGYLFWAANTGNL